MQQGKKLKGTETGKKRKNIQLKCTTRLPWQLVSMLSMTSVRIQCKLYREMNCHVSDIDRSERGKKGRDLDGVGLVIWYMRFLYCGPREADERSGMSSELEKKRKWALKEVKCSRIQMRYEVMLLWHLVIKRLACKCCWQRAMCLMLYAPCIIKKYVRIWTNKMHKILMIRLYFLLDALRVSDYISPSSGATFISCT